MANYTISTNAGQEATLDAVLPIVNAQRAIGGQAALTKAQLVDSSMNDKIRDFRAQVLAEQRVAIVPALDTATASQINQIKAILGL